MPTVECDWKDLEQLVGKKFSSKEELSKAVEFAKGELDSVEGNALKIDIKDSNRPDLWSAEGIARELRAQYGIEKGIPSYKVKSSGRVAIVDPALEGIRPIAAYAIAKGVKVTDELIRQLVQLQEKICGSYGRKRLDIAIGIFDLDQVHGNARYYAADKSVKFVPLGMSEKQSLEEILKRHPKGIEFGKLLEGKSKYPLLVDEKNNVLSFPPIINSNESGKITTQTKNLFIDCTGFSQEKVNLALEIVCAALSDRGAKLESVEVHYGKKKIITPSFESDSISFSEKEWNITGMHWKEKEIAELLAKKRMIAKKKGIQWTVEFPSYRKDVLHAMDIVEDALIAFDFNKIVPIEPNIPSIGSLLDETRALSNVRESMVGLGFQEIATFTLTSKEKQEQKVGLQNEPLVEIENYGSLQYQVFRNKLLPEMLEFLSNNKDAAFPQRVFEVGKVVELDSSNPNGFVERNALCACITQNSITFNEAKSALQSLCGMMGWKFELKEANMPLMIEGRGAQLSVDGRRGFIGEVHPKTLQNFGIENPVAFFAIRL